MTDVNALLQSRVIKDHTPLYPELHAQAGTAQLMAAMQDAGTREHVDTLVRNGGFSIQPAVYDHAGNPAGYAVGFGGNKQVVQEAAEKASGFNLEALQKLLKKAAQSL